MAVRKSEIEKITSLLEKTFRKHPWYGSSVMKILAEVDHTQVHRRHGQAHTIAELVLHMISWRDFVTHRLKGDNSFEVSDDLNFPKPKEGSKAWEASLSGLQASQDRLLGALKNFPEENLGELVPASSQRYTYYTLIHGVIHHDVYHLGQIAILNKINTG